MNNQITELQNKTLCTFEFALRITQTSDGKKALVFFDQYLFHRPLKKDLIEIVEFLNNTIDNFEVVDLTLDSLNKKLEHDYFNPTYEKKDVVKKIKSGFIYIAKCTTTNYFKIGITSKSVQHRINQLKTANPSIELIKSYIVKDVELEKKLHEMFADKNVNREWFSLSKLDLKIIEKFISEKQ